MDNLEDIITASLEDADLAPEPETSTPDEVPTEPIEVAPEASNEPTEPSEATPSLEVSSPGTKSEDPSKVPQDDFEKKYGLQANSASGRENRIPYSRVKKITEKAAADAVATAKKEWETTSSPKLQEFETKVKTYEDRLERVAKFEQVLANEPQKFLEMLSNIPSYAQFFKAVEEAFKFQAEASTKPVEEVPENDPMPEPDQKAEDGSGNLLYSMEGIKALQEWNRRQARKETLLEVEKTYGPAVKSWQEEKERAIHDQEVTKRYNEAVTTVQSQIAEARTWHLFKENEDAITKTLQENPKLSLEGAYQKVVFPRLVTDRNKLREEILNEIKKAPPVKSTSAPASVGKPAPKVSSGPRPLEDVIAESIASLKR